MNDYKQLINVWSYMQTGIMYNHLVLVLIPIILIIHVKIYILWYGILASCPWGPVTANGVDLLTEMYINIIQSE